MEEVPENDDIGWVEVPKCDDCGTIQCHGATRKCVVAGCGKCLFNMDIVCFEHRHSPESLGAPHCYIVPCAYPKCIGLRHDISNSHQARPRVYSCKHHKVCGCLTYGVDDGCVAIAIEAEKSVHQIHEDVWRLYESGRRFTEYSSQCPQHLRKCLKCDFVQDHVTLCSSCKVVYSQCCCCAKVYVKSSRCGYAIYDQSYCTSCVLGLVTNVAFMIRVWQQSKALLAMYRRLARGDEQVVVWLANYRVYTPQQMSTILTSTDSANVVKADAEDTLSPYMLLRLCEMLPKDVLNLILKKL